jgi:hypothetical protein
MRDNCTLQNVFGLDAANGESLETLQEGRVKLDIRKSHETEQ